MSRLMEAIGQSPRALDDTVISSGDQSLTRAQMMALVAKRRQFLQGIGASRIAYALDNSINWIIWDLAVLDAGCDAIPVPTFFTPAQQQHVINNAEVDVFIGESTLPFSGEWHRFESCDNCLEGASMRVRPPLTRAVGQKITYTSGTTGNPKGVCISYDTIATVAISLQKVMQAYGINRHLAVLPLATLLENIAGVYVPLINGTLVNVPSLAELGYQGSGSLNPQQFAKALNQVAPHSLICVPQLLDVINGLVSAGCYPAADQLKFVAVGGGKVSHQALVRSRQLGVPVFEGYGLSECCSVVTLNLPNARRAGSVGRALPHANVRISPSGEVEIAGVRMTGYLHAEPNRDAWYCTGDLGHIDDDGYLHIDGRKRDVFINAYGRNVDPVWVEAELAAHGVIRRALVFGEAQPNCSALLWAQGDASQSAIENAVAAANLHLPDYARVEKWTLIEAAFPDCLVTPNGRIRRREAEQFIATHTNQEVTT